VNTVYIVRAVAAVGFVLAPISVDAKQNTYVFSDRPRLASVEFISSSESEVHFAGYRVIGAITSVSVVEDRLLSALFKLESELDPDQFRLSKQGIIDAVKTLEATEVVYLPYASMTEDGVSVLKWSAPGRDMMLLFGGDGVATLSLVRDGESFVRNAKDYPNDITFPKKLRDAVIDFFS
jgi:hypothetical protein